MPQYTIVFKNQSDTQHPKDWTHVEHCTAPDAATVEAILRRDAGRFVNVDLYTWTITETAP
jgi:hypothetical protein